MKVYIMMQKKGNGLTRVREVFLNKQKAEDFIGTLQPKTIECECCGQQKKNPAYYDNATEQWKRNLFIVERNTTE